MSQQSLHSGRKYLVTGGARGIGKAIVAELHSLGATVYALARNPDNLKKLKEEFPKVIPVCVDLSDWEATKKALEGLETVDCVINNAGVVVPSRSFFDIQPDSFDSQVNINLKAVINVCQVMSKKMIDRGQGGCIVNVTGVPGRKPFNWGVVYGLTKVGVEHLTKQLAIELGPQKIRVNAVCPAAVATDMAKETMANLSLNEGEAVLTELDKMVISRTPTKARYMPIQDVVNTVLFLASNATTQITGESIAVDGGLIIG